MQPLLRDLFISFRNVTRQKRRSGLGVAAVAFGVIALLEAGGFIEWATSSLREDTIHSMLGHLQVVRAGYYESGFADPFAYLLPDDSPALKLAQRTPGVVIVAPRLDFNGLISIGETTVPFVGQGMDPTKEVELNTGTAIMAGQTLSADDPKGIIVGQGLAANLGVKVGEPITLLANTATGSMNGVEGRVRGVFKTSIKAYDDAVLRVPLSMARQLLRVSGSHVWVILLKDTGATAATVAALAPQMAAQKLQIVPWYDLADFYNKSVELFKQQVAVIKSIITVIIVLCISNTLTLSVMERTGEIGTSMALGLRRRNILQQFIGEGMVIGIIGSIAGVAVGIILAKFISSLGIPLPPPPGTTKNLAAQIWITPNLALNAALLATVTTALAAIYPALKGARMMIVDALRFNR
uniref:LolE permease component of an ABC-transporter system n=1 Tax=uncultured bacterium CSL142 TaxID=1091569 RepID=G4WVL9_9BACT|nr:LolE permease component of an ABC-transporter system [uncultured bacterium CSL142]